MEGEEGLLKDARRLLAVNAGEQKRLEKLQRHIEKKRREKERILTRAQEDAIAKFYEDSGELLYLDKGRNLSVKAVVSRDVVSKGHEISAEAKGKDIERQIVQRKKLSLQENSSKMYLPGLDLTVFGLKAQALHRTRTRSWSGSSLNQLEGRKYRGETISLKEEQSSSLNQKQKLSIHENTVEQTREEKPEKPLSAILPPLVLPPLHQHRRPSLQEHNKNYYRTGSNLLCTDKSLKEQYEDLSECRYLRVYQRKDI